MFKAGFSSVCSQAAVAILANEGDPIKAMESLTKAPAVKSLATSMLSAGIMDKVGRALQLPDVFSKKTAAEFAKASLAKASVNAVLNMSINGQDGEEALRSGLTDAAVSTVAGIASQKIGDMASTKQAKPVDPITHKVLHAAVGGVSGAVLGGKKGAAAGAIGAVVAETVAEQLKPGASPEHLSSSPEVASKVREVVAEQQRPLTKEEFAAVLQGASREKIAKIADRSKLAAAVVSLLARQNVTISIETATTALENNLMQTEHWSGLTSLEALYGSYLANFVEERLDELGLSEDGNEHEVGAGGAEEIVQPEVKQEDSGLVDDGGMPELPDVTLGELPVVPSKTPAFTLGTLARPHQPFLGAMAVEIVSPRIRGTSEGDAFILRRPQGLFAAYPTQSYSPLSRLPFGASDAIIFQDHLRFAKGVVKGATFGAGATAVAMVPVVGPVIVGAATVGMVGVAGKMATEFEQRYFALTSEYDAIMANPLISDAKKEAIAVEYNVRLRQAIEEGAKAKSLSQIYKDNAEGFGMVAGGIFGGWGASRVVSTSNAGMLRLFDIRRETDSVRSYVLNNIAASKVARANSGYCKASRRFTAIGFYLKNDFTYERTVKHIVGIDFNRSVIVKRLAPGEMAIQYQYPYVVESGNYFAPLETPGSKLGIYTSGRKPLIWSTVREVEVLESTAAPIIDKRSMVKYGWEIELDGGGTQYFSPDKSAWRRIL